VSVAGGAILSPHGRAHGGLVVASEIPRLPPVTDNYPLLSFKDIYATVGAIGLSLAERAKDLAGTPVRVRGYMAPPIADRDSYFVLTRAPIVTCPFCDPGGSWPDDVVVALLEGDTRFVDPAVPVEVVGELDLGRKLDPRTGVTRLVRLREARWQTVL
jgi:hypothetical protein